jgi:hypothetical protein
MESHDWLNDWLMNKLLVKYSRKSAQYVLHSLEYERVSCLPARSQRDIIMRFWATVVPLLSNPPWEPSALFNHLQQTPEYHCCLGLSKETFEHLYFLPFKDLTRSWIHAVSRFKCVFDPFRYQNSKTTSRYSPPRGLNLAVPPRGNSEVWLPGGSRRPPSSESCTWTYIL